MSRNGPREPRLVTFGETMLRFSPPDGARIETATELEFRSGGAESNVAVAASNLGTPTAWLSKLPASPLGRKVARDVRHHGVEPRVAWSEDGRQGAYFLEYGDEPQGVDVVYDRADAAVTTATVDDLDVEAVRGADVFFTSGITPALSATLADTTRELFEAAREAGVRTAFDVNYRSKLWEPERACETCEELLDLADLVFVPERDARSVLGYDGDAADVAADLRATHGVETVVVTCGDRGAVAAGASGVVEQPIFEADTVDPIGTGDAFVGGFLAERLDGGGLDDALEYGAATAALSRTLTGDQAVFTRAEVDAVVAEGADDISR